MANIKITLDYPIVDGQPLTFKAPCDCTEITGLIVYYPDGESTASKVFTFRDAHCNDLTGLGNLFAAGAYVKVLVDTTGNYAYIQNADNNKYLDDQLKNLMNKKANISFGSYVGTGTYGKDNPCTLEFDFKPMLVVVYGESMNLSTLFASYGAATADRKGYINGQYRTEEITDHFTWDGFSFSWYSDLGYTQTEDEEGVMQLNAEGTTYHYLAIGI